MTHIQNNDSVIAFFGHHKCATSWVIKYLYYLSLHLFYRYENYHSPKMFGHDIQKHIDSKRIDMFSYTNANQDYLVDLLAGNVKAFHIVRDPRDIIVSAYYSHKYSHHNDFWPELPEHREKLSRLDKEEGIFYIIDYLQNMIIDGQKINVFADMENWNYSCQNVKEVRFETFIKNPYIYMIDILEFLNLLDEDKDTLVSLVLDRVFTLYRKKRKITLKNALRQIYLQDFMNITKGRRQGHSDKKHHYRKGVAGDWSNHLSEEHKSYIKKHLNDCLLKLGYIDHTDW